MVKVVVVLLVSANTMWPPLPNWRVWMYQLHQVFLHPSGWQLNFSRFWLLGAQPKNLVSEVTPLALYARSFVW
jgi:hypothetical protein